ncbi:MAG: hypothetical protein IJZ34_06570 [Lachnospiraceae bacterium]|nr:hypothetical protein [Lachnospiraceae bacterium]
MKKRKLNYVIHNPNTMEKTADFLLEILIAANAEKVEQALREAAAPNEEQKDETECAV